MLLEQSDQIRVCTVCLELSVHYDIYSNKTKTDLSHLMTNPTKWHVHPVKTQISLGIRPFCSESSLSAWRNIGSSATNWVQCEDSDQIGRMPRLIWVFGRHTDHFVGFVMRQLICRNLLMRKNPIDSYVLPYSYHVKMISTTFRNPTWERKPFNYRQRLKLLTQLSKQIRKWDFRSSKNGIFKREFSLGSHFLKVDVLWQNISHCLRGT